MTRLIDADALRERMYHDAFETDSDMQKWDSGCWIRYKMFENALEEAPTVDAEPVKHGHWVEILDSPMLPLKLSMCSECGAEYAPQQTPHFSYCPHCGAKMDEVEDAKEE